MDCRCGKALQSWAGRLGDARRDIFPPRLVGCDPKLLRGLNLVVVFDEALPSLPREFVIIADAYERPVCASVLDIDIADVRTIDRPVAFKRGRHMKIPHLA